MVNIVNRVGCHHHYCLFISTTFTKPSMGVIQAPMIPKEGITFTQARYTPNHFKQNFHVILNMENRYCRYVPVNLENIFSKYALTAPNKITLKELWNLTEGNRMAIDPFGWLVPKNLLVLS